MSEQESDHPDLEDFFVPKFNPAELAFAIVLTVFSVVLVVQFDSQTKIIPGKSWVYQPGFWSIQSAVWMVIFGIPYLATVIWKKKNYVGTVTASGEILSWVVASEFAIWFLGYVLIVPILGYIAATTIFCVTLTVRLGYRDKKYIFWSATSGLATVVTFKSFLGVKIPGGLVYEYLPTTIRNFMIVNF